MDNRDTFYKLLREAKDEVLVMGSHGRESAGPFSRGLEKA